MRLSIIAALAIGLSGCGVTPDQIRDFGTAARTIGDEIRLTRCDLIPNARIEELRSCTTEE